MCTDDVRECVCLLLQLCVRVRVCVTATLVSLKSELVVGTINRRRVMQAEEKKRRLGSKLGQIFFSYFLAGHKPQPHRQQQQWQHRRHLLMLKKNH